MNGQEPSFPTLLAEEARRGITEYLSTTFALADAEARDTLAAFLDHPERGMFRGPYLRVRTPFPPVEQGWPSPLDWLPQGFVSFRHQAAAFERLSTRDRAAQPTIVTTGTGSGKTESFLLPLLDHARRVRQRGETGITAIVLYPMNALVTDQARRLARYLHDEPALAGVSAGVYVGGTGTQHADSRRARRQARGTAREPARHPAHQLQDARPPAAAPGRRESLVGVEHEPAVPRPRRVPHLRRRPGHRRRHAPAPPRRRVPGRGAGTPARADRARRDLGDARLGHTLRRSPDVRPHRLRCAARRVGIVTEERLDADDVVPDIDFELEIPDVTALVAAPAPLAQLWIRELHRMLRRVAVVPEFAWWHDGPDDAEGRWLPAAHCRVCGRSGWIVVVSELGDVGHEPVAVWAASARHRNRKQTRTLLVADADEPGARYLDPGTLALTAGRGEDGVPVLVGTAEQAVEQDCPSCEARNAIRFLGSSVATLLSVALTQMFGSDALPDPEKKTLVFTDAVQDAAHRAAFIEGRAFQFNFRSALVRAIGDGPTSLSDAGRTLAGATDRELYALAPPDFTRRENLVGEWLAHDPGHHRRRLLATRIGFQALLEVGRNARLGRTLELTGAIGVDVDVDLEHAAAVARDVHENLPERGLELADPLVYRRWVLGLLDHLRTRGGIHHDWLARYVADDGRRWSIWGRSAPGMPKFPRGRPAPGFLTTGAAGDTEFIGLRPQGEGWVVDWTRRCLGLGAGEGKALLGAVVDTLAEEQGPLERRTSAKGASVYGLRPRRVLLHREQRRLECPVCHHVQPCAPARERVWDGSPCPRCAASACSASSSPRPSTSTGRSTAAVASAASSPTSTPGCWSGRAARRRSGSSSPAPRR